MKNIFKDLLFGHEQAEKDEDELETARKEKQLKNLINIEDDLPTNVSISKEVKETTSKQEVEVGFSNTAKKENSYGTTSQENSSEPALTVFIPKEFDEVKKIAEFIKLRKVVTINLEEMESKAAQRIMDFLTGAMSVTGAEFIKISKYVYASVPENTNILYNNKAGR